MNAPNKQRLIGLAVLIVILAIFIPLFFHNPHPANQQKSSNPIAENPQKSQLILKLPQANQNSPSISSASLPLPSSDKKPKSFLNKPARPIIKTAYTSQPCIYHSSKKNQKPMPLKPVAFHKVKTSDQIQKGFIPPEAWVLQLGSFANQANAKHLVKKLRQYGFDAYTREVHYCHKTLTQLFVGPEISQKRIQHIRKALAHQYPHLKGLIIRYRT